MNVANEEIKDGKKVVKFATTPIMSSYLVAFVCLIYVFFNFSIKAVGEFDFIEGKTSSGTPVRVSF